MPPTMLMKPPRPTRRLTVRSSLFPARNWRGQRPSWPLLRFGLVVDEGIAGLLTRTSERYWPEKAQFGNCRNDPDLLRVLQEEL